MENEVAPAVGDWVRVAVRIGTEVGKVEALATFNGEPCAAVDGLPGLSRWVPVRRIVEIVR